MRPQSKICHTTRVGGSLSLCTSRKRPKYTIYTLYHTLFCRAISCEIELMFICTNHKNVVVFVCISTRTIKHIFDTQVIATTKNNNLCRANFTSIVAKLL